MPHKTRLDKLLVAQGLCRSRNQAQELIALDLVEVKRGSQWMVISKASAALSPTSTLRIIDNSLQKYVSRAALKLLGAFERLNISVKDLRALDVGQSTGGFTQVLLEKGVSEVVGIEVGQDQLAAELKEDSRVTCLEGLNARDLATVLQQQVINTSSTESPSAPPQAEPKGLKRFDIAVMDVSFISQTLIIPELRKVLKPDGILLSLVKPQFEAGRNGTGKGGIVTNSRIYANVEKKIRDCCSANHFEIKDYFASPITGSDGNNEFFLCARAVG